ncbi:MAG: hypothetical protein ACLPWF_25590 [Bryobacteraceae bacterium]
MPALAKKEVELKYLEMARTASLMIPAGEVYCGEKPDFRIQTSRGLLGVEITRFYQDASPGELRQPMHERGLRHRIVSEAKRSYEGKGGPPVTVETFFSSEINLSEWKLAAKQLAEFVFREAPHVPVNGKPYKFGVDARTGFQQINIRPSLAGRAEWIEASENDRPQELLYQTVKNNVEAKSQKLTQYESMPLGTWLLMVVDPFPRAAYICVPKDIDSWTFRSDFEKILMFSREEHRVLEFGKP